MPSEAEVEAAAEALSRLLKNPPSAMREAALAALEAAEQVRAADAETGDIAG